MVRFHPGMPIQCPVGETDITKRYERFVGGSNPSWDAIQRGAMAYDAKSCYRCGSWITDDFPSHLCASCRAAIHYEQQTAGKAVERLAARLTPFDYAWLWSAGIRLDADLMNIPCTMTCPRCKNPVTKYRTEDTFACSLCGWKQLVEEPRCPKS